MGLQVGIAVTEVEPHAIIQDDGTELAGSRELLVLSAAGYRTYDKQCEALVAAVAGLRGPPTLLFRKAGKSAQLLHRFG